MSNRTNSWKGLYSGGFVVNVIVDGEMLTVGLDNTLNLPFKSEYVIRLQNKNDRRAVAKVYLDDENVSNDGYVIPANDYVDIEIPVNSEFKFKFVSLNSSEAANASKSTNNDGEKGTIRVEFQLEKEKGKYLPRAKPNLYTPWIPQYQPFLLLLIIITKVY